MEFRFGGLTFTSKFDSGNLANVEKVSKEDEESDQTGPSVSPSTISPLADVKPDFEFNVWTNPDCAGTQFVNGNRSWFYFGVRGGPAGKVMKINIMNMNRQGRLYSQGHLPMVRTVPGRPKWERIRDKPVCESSSTNFVLSFNHRFFESRSSVTYFAFSYPWSYETCQERLKELDEKFKSAAELGSKSVKSSIYYHRELLCHSLECRRVDLITVSDCHGIQDMEEPKFDTNLFTDLDSKRCKSFVGKKVYVVSSRVHPGETPGSFVFNGFLDFILREDDPRSKQLRKQYVFKMIPLLNPDGVSRGHYRTDTRGVNLNRVYLDPVFELYPSIYAAKSLLVYHHIWNSDLTNEEKEAIALSVRTETPAETGGKNKEEVGSEFVFSDDVGGCAVSSVTRNFVFGCNVTEPVERPGPPTSMFDYEAYRITGSTYVASFPLNAAHPAVNCETNQGNPDLEGPSQSSNSAVDDNSKPSMSCTGDLNSLPNSDNSSYFVSVGDLLESSGDAADDPPVEFTSRPMEPAFAVERVVEAETYARAVQYIPKRDSLPSSADLNDFPSGGECEDFDDDFQRGNEGSDDEGNDKTPAISDVVKTPHLSHPRLLSIPPGSSGIAFYVDLHGHAAKRGCFIYGNYFAEEETQIESMLFVKLIALNSAHFDFGGCNFTEKNMYTVDKKDGSSKEGSGRVAAFKALGIIHSYTLECNYNTGRLINTLSQASGDDGRATPPPVAGFPPKYTPAHYEEVGRAMAVAAIDFTETNPWSRLPSSDHLSVFGLKEHMKRCLQSLRAPAKALLSRTGKTGAKSGVSQAAGSLPRVALLSRHSANHAIQSQQNIENNVNASCNGNSTNSKAVSRTEAKKFTPAMKKADLSSVKDAPQRLTSSGQQRQRPFSFASGPPSTSTATTSSSTAAAAVPSSRSCQTPSSHLPPAAASRRPARCAVMSLAPLSAPIDSSSSSSWSASFEFMPKRQSSATFQSKAGSASSTSARAQHFQSMFYRQSRISKSLNADVMTPPPPHSSLDFSTIRTSVNHALLAGITSEMEVAPVGPGCERIPCVEASIYQWPSYADMGLRKQVTDSSSQSLSRGPPVRAKRDDMFKESSVLSSMSLTEDLTSTSLLSFSAKQCIEDGKRSSIPIDHSLLSKPMEANAKISVTPRHLGSNAPIVSQLSSFQNTTNTENNPESCKSKAVKGNKASTSGHDKSVHHMGLHPSPTGSKKTKRKKKISSDKKT